jgi:BlaI family transcriptional regulator, penicillinase repressor
MRVLWQRGPSTNMDVVTAITDPPLARNTVMTTLGVLERKGYVAHETEGRTFIYRPLIMEDAVQTKALENVLRRFFDGSAEQLVLKLFDNRKISVRDRKRIQELLEKARD